MPLIGWLLHSKPLPASFALVDLVGVGYSALLLCNSEALLRTSFALVALSQQLLYSTYFAAVARLFGFANYGKLSGLINLLVAALGLLQYALAALAVDLGFAAVNVALLVAVLPLLAYSLARLMADRARGGGALELAVEGKAGPLLNSPRA
ncbi:hypothetical protein T492DRAFT_839191 [Pavlovales sp. CCMP2436]|nr:hypothetical protein T492DRAFT_839191 [Pavlovales sp. CCMP2436]